MKTDFRQETLDRLGFINLAPIDSKEPEDSLACRWNNFASDDRDRMHDLIMQEYWQNLINPKEVRDILKFFPKNSKMLISLLCAESLGHLTSDYRVAECRKVSFDFCHGRVTRKELKIAVAAINPVNSGFIKYGEDTAFPTERAEAIGINRPTGNFRSSRTCTIFLPTIPVAPATITSYNFI